MKLDSYQAELKLLKENARDFARKYPALAPHLASSSNDPDVERILQGTAYLSAGIRDRLESDFPEFAQSVLRLVAPDYLKEIPATTIVEYKPRNILNSAVKIKKGAKIDSQKLTGVSCRFHACTDVTIYPLTINACELQQSGEDSELEITFNNTSIANTEVKLSELTLHLAGDYIDASHLYYLLTRKLKGVSLIRGNQVDNLTNASVEPLGWNTDFELLLNSRNEFSSYRRLQEYFVNKFKFLFLKLTGLNDNESLPQAFKIRFSLSGTSHNTQVDINSFKLFCTPAINLFESDAEPIALNYKSTDLELTPIRNSQGQFTVHSVLSVHGQSRQSAQKTEYKPFSIAAKEQNNAPVYELLQRYSEEQDSNSVLRISFPEEYDLPSMEILTSKLMCTNGKLCNNLKIGDISANTPDIPDVVSLRNISPVSPYLPPITDGRVLWKLLAHLTANYLPIANLENLKALLQLYNPISKNDAKDHAANLKRIESIRSLKSKAVDKLHRGTLIRGTRITLDIEGSGFSSIGDLYLFGELLNYLFKQFSDINSFIELKVNDLSTGEQLIWQSSLTSH